MFESGKFYFVKKEFYERFADCNLMTNKAHGFHGRPCYFALKVDNLKWLVPISSQVEKYQKIYDEKILRYRNYDGIKFGYVNGQRRAFLLQNLFPITSFYLDNVYFINGGKVAATVNKKFAVEIEKAVRKILLMRAKGIRITLTDIDKIISKL